MNGDSFAALAAQPDAPLDRLALAMAAEFGPVHVSGALAELDRLAAGIAPRGAAPPDHVDALREILGRRAGFRGDREHYDDPDNSMLDVVLARRRGLPIALSVVYVEVARRAGIALRGIGLPGHYVVGHFGSVPPLLLDPFNGGAPLEWAAPVDIRPWSVHETVLRMLNNLVGSYLRRADLTRAIRAAELRLELPLTEPQASALKAELRSLRARLN